MTEEKKKEETERFVETILERGLGYKLSNGELLEVSSIDPALLRLITDMYEDLQTIKKHIG